MEFTFITGEGSISGHKVELRGENTTQVFFQLSETFASCKLEKKCLERSFAP